MSTTESIIEEIMPDLYYYERMRANLHPNTDLSHSNRCHILSIELFRALDARNIECRRELHKVNDAWHYVVATASPTEPPSQQDLIVDPNPWQFEPTAKHSGFLYDSRINVQVKLGEAGAPEWFVGLRGIASIVEAHAVIPLAQGLL
jgi:hypothetical protein